MDIEPYWGVIIGVAVGGIIKLIFFSGRKAKKQLFSIYSISCHPCRGDERMIY